MKPLAQDSIEGQLSNETSLKISRKAHHYSGDFMLRMLQLCPTNLELWELSVVKYSDSSKFLIKSHCNTFKL